MTTEEMEKEIVRLGSMTQKLLESQEAHFAYTQYLSNTIGSLIMRIQKLEESTLLTQEPSKIAIV